MSLNQIGLNNIIRPWVNIVCNDLTVSNGIIYKPSTGNTGDLLELGVSGPFWTTVSSTVQNPLSQLYIRYSSASILTNSYRNLSSIIPIVPVSPNFVIANPSITVLNTGKYLISFSTSSIWGNKTGSLYINRFSNGINTNISGEISLYGPPPVTSAPSSISFSFMVQLNAGDVIETFAKVINGITPLNLDNFNTTLAMIKIS